MSLNRDQINSIAHLARLSLTEAEIPIVLSGLRPGEKLYEERFYASERLLATPHEKVHRTVSDLISVGSFRPCPDTSAPHKDTRESLKGDWPEGSNGATPVQDSEGIQRLDRAGQTQRARGLRHLCKGVTAWAGSAV